MSTVLTIQELSFAYRDYLRTDRNRQVLRQVDLRLEAGTKALVLGAPDSGKSTLSRILCALVPRHAQGELRGTITIGGTPLASVAPWDLTDTVTLVTQNPQEQLLMTTCADEIAFPLESLALPREQMVERVNRCLQRWDLAALAEVNPQELSGGERKRLLLAVAEAIDAPVWIMDEPFDDLDEQWRSVLLQRLVESRRSVLLFASRYLEEFRGSFDRYFHLHDGILAEGSEEQVAIEFERESEMLFSAVEHTVPSAPKVRLSCSDATIIHPRRSVTSIQPFTLKVPEFHVDPGQVVALVGPNGAGKSTLSRVLCGLDPHHEGLISIGGTAMSDKQLQVRVGYLFQNPDFGIFLPTVRDELGWSLRFRKHLSAADRERMVAECATLFHLDPEENPTMMSYGARKHLQAAVYHMLDRPFLIVDELDSGVTYSAAFEIIALLRSKGAGVVIITHDRTFAKNLAERQYRIIDGTVVETEVGA